MCSSTGIYSMHVADTFLHLTDTIFVEIEYLRTKKDTNISKQNNSYVSTLCTYYIRSVM